MTSDELIDALSARTGFRKQACERFVKDFTRIIEDTLINNEQVKIKNFGAFQMKHRSKRVARNPHNNEQLILPEHYAPVFKFTDKEKEFIETNWRDEKW